MSLKVVHLTPAQFDAIRYKYQDVKAAELDANMVQNVINHAYITTVLGLDPKTGEPLDVDAREYLAKRKGDDEDPLGGLKNL